MKKLIAFITICCFSFLVNDQTAICKANCNLTIIKSIEKQIDTDHEIITGLNPLRPYDGFFIKL